MNVNKNFMPEGYYSLDSEMSLDKIFRVKDSGDFLVATAVSWNKAKQCVIAYLGNDFKSEIPLNEFSIYPVTHEDGFLAPSVYSLIGKNIHVSVLAISEDNTIVLSRKAAMLKAFNFIEQCGTQTVTCLITSISNYGLFVDVGFGISGLIRTRDLAVSRVANPADLGFRPKQFIDAQITSVDPSKHQISLNHKDLFESEAYSLIPGDIVQVLTLSPVNENEDGYFVYLSPNTDAIMNPPDGVKIPYGSKALAVVRPFSSKHPDKIRLKFLRFID